MKQVLAFVVVFFIFSYTCFSQTQPYHVVFDITTGDTATHQRLIRWVKGIIDSHPDAKVEIVFYGRSLDMVVKTKSTVANDIINLGTNKKVTFAICEHAMKVFNIEKNQLLDGTITVPDSVYELVKKQAEGYGYIKVTN